MRLVDGATVTIADTEENQADMAEQHGRYDRLAERVERIERRLELSSDM